MATKVNDVPWNIVGESEISAENLIDGLMYSHVGYCTMSLPTGGAVAPIVVASGHNFIILNTGLISDYNNFEFTTQLQGIFENVPYLIPYIVNKKLYTNQNIEIITNSTTQRIPFNCKIYDSSGELPWTINSCGLSIPPTNTNVGTFYCSVSDTKALKANYIVIFEFWRDK